MSNGEKTSVADVRLRRSCGILMGLFAFVWANVAGGGSAQLPLFVAALAITVATFLLALRPRGEGSRLLDADWQQRYNRIGLIQFGAIAVVVVASIALDAAQLIAPLVCVVVGVHFLPLATLFVQPLFRWSGIALVVVGAVGVALALGESGGEAARLVVGLGAAVVLWATSVATSRSLDVRSPAPVG
ncbi:MAG TPA: hypothetical protein VFG88_04485 [Nocardioidaceae bacterium]|nr:hypothetical protein [Nocardioidaceae bacterium]